MKCNVMGHTWVTEDGTKYDEDNLVYYLSHNETMQG